MASGESKGTRQPVRAASLLLLGLVAGLPPVGAATFVWDGGHPAQERLSDNQNWNPNGAPTNDGTADLIFTGAVRLNPTVDAAWSVNSITFNYLAGAFDLNGASSLTIQGNSVASAITNDDADTQTISAPLITAGTQTWTANAGALAISGTVSNNFALTLSGAANTTISGAISGSGSLHKTGAGTLFLSGANTYSGGTTIAAGTVQGTTDSVQGNIVDNAALVFDQTTTGTYAGAITGSGSVTKSGSGTVTFSGANSYSGGTTVSSGTLRVSGGNALSDTGAVVLADVSGATLDLNGSAETIGALSGGGSSGGNVTLGSGGVLTVGGANSSTTFAGSISGAGALVKTGSGILTLSGSNSYSAGTTVSAGTLQGSAASLQGDISTASGASLVFDQTSSGTYSGVVSGSGSLTKTGAGLLTLSGANSYSGGTTVSAGVLRVSGGSALSDTGAVVLADVSGATLDLNGSSEAIGSLSGGGSNGGNVTLGSGGVLTVGGANSSTTFAGSISGAGALVKTGSDTLTLSGSNSYSAGTTVSAGTLQGSSASLQGDISTASGSSLVFDQSSAGTYSGVVSGSGSLTKTGAGTLTLTGANSYSGATTVSAGTLALGASDALSASSALSLGSGTTLALGGAYSARVGTLGYSDATLDFGATGAANAFLFTGAGAYSGTLTVLNWESGSDTLAFASGASIADAFIENVYFSGIGSGVRGATGVSVFGYGGTWDTIVAAASTFSTWDGGGANNTFATAANWSGDVAPASGTSTKIAFAGSTRTAPNLNTDFTLNSLKFDPGASSFTLSATPGRTLTFDGPVPSLIQASASTQTVAAPVALTKNTFVEISGAGNLVVSGAVSGAGGFTVLGSGAGEVILSGANSYTGSTAINAGTVVLQNGAALGDVSSGTSVASGATLRLENNISVGAEALALSGTLRQGSGTNSYAGAISGAGNLVVAGGQLTLSGSSANSYSGSTTVNAGTLVLGKSAGVTAIAGNLTLGDGSGTDTVTLAVPNQIADSSRVTLSSGGTPVFNLANNHETIGSLASSNTAASVVLGSATLATGADNSSSTFAGVLSGTGGALTKQGSGTFTLSGANSHTGATTVSAGTLVVQNSSALGTTATGTTVASGATLQLENNVSVGTEALALSGTLRQASGTNSYAGAISGTGNVVVAGGQLTLSGSSANSYSGATTINAGTLVLGKSAGVTAVAGHLTIGDGSGTDTLALAAAHQIADSSRVTLSSGGTPVFNLANNHETIGSLASSNTAASVVLGSATLATGADNTSSTFAGVVSGTGGLTKQGSGAFTLSGANTYTGATTISAGTLALGASNRLSDSSTLALAGGTFSLGGLYSERVGNLSYTDGSVIDFGSPGTANRLLFAADDASSGTLTLRNWTSGADTFGSLTNTLAQSFLDNIYFDGLGVGVGAEIGSLVSVPGYGDFYEIRPIATFAWIGGNSNGSSPVNGWTKGDNWSGGIAPGVGADKALVFGGAVDLANDMNGAFIVRSIRYDSSAGAFVTTSSTGDTLTIRGGGIYNDSTATQTLNVPVSVGADQTWTAANGALSVTGATLLLGTHTLTVTGAADTTISSIVSGTGSAALVKNGAGTLSLSGANTYAGTVVVNAGTLAVSHASALGTTAAGTTVNSGGTLALSGGIVVGAEALSLAGSGTASAGALRNVSGDNSYAGAITLASDATIASDSGTLTLSGGINLSTYAATFAGAGDIAVTGAVTNAAGDVVKNGSGTLTFSGANTYIGTTSINAGTLVAAHSSALGTTAGGTTVASGATLALSGGISIGAEALTLSGTGAGGIGALRNNSGDNAYAGAITLAGATTLTSAAGTLSLTGTIAAGGNTITVNGAGDLTIASAISGAGDFSKSGSGALAFTADQSFSGEFTLGGGTLSLDNVDVSVATLRVTAASVLDFSGASTLTVGQLIVELGDGETLSITSWQELSDFFYVSNFLGASYDLQGQSPTTGIVFATFSPDDTRWRSGTGEVTPVPEPASYGLLAFGGLLAWRALRRRRVLHV